MSQNLPASPQPVAVIGGGSIGVAWSIVFARGGLTVRIFEPDSQRRAAIVGEIRGKLEDLASAELLAVPPDRLLAQISTTATIAEATAGAAHIQECAPESLSVKRELFAELDDLAPSDVTIATSSSAIPASAVAGDLSGRSRCLVVHPGNPPYLLPIVEVVPAPFTAQRAVNSMVALLEACGMAPIVLNKEVEGFVFNRLQGAVLREAYCLVRDGVVKPSDLDRVVSEGLGRRWSIIGPFATAELNTRGGIEAHAARLGEAYARMGAERGQDDPWTEDLVATVAADIHRLLPPEGWDEHVRARDRALMSLERWRRQHQSLFPE